MNIYIFAVLANFFPKENHSLKIKPEFPVENGMADYNGIEFMLDHLKGTITSKLLYRIPSIFFLRQNTLSHSSLISFL